MLGEGCFSSSSLWTADIPIYEAPFNDTLRSIPQHKEDKSSAILITDDVWSGVGFGLGNIPSN
jgi:hypothetical protein